MKDTKQLPVLTVAGQVLFPGVVLSLDVADPTAIELVDRLLEQSKGKPARLVVLTRRGETAEDVARVGTEADLVRARRIAGNRLGVVLRGVGRVRVLELPPGQREARVETLPDRVDDPIELEGLSISVRDAVKQLAQRAPKHGREGLRAIDDLADPALLADVAAANVELSLDERLALLGEPDVPTRMKKVLEAVLRATEAIKVRDEIDEQVRAEIGKQQREHVLRRQLKAIEDELGEGDAAEEDVIVELEERIEKALMPDEVQTVARRQLDRLRQMQPGAPEYALTRTYLEWLVDLPWSKENDDRLEMAEVRQVLEVEHYGLEKVKKRIVEFLAVRKLAPGKRGPILCLVGPPGVGKTSLAKSIANALGRPLVRQSLGGVRDEAEIRGHRRTYLGALPGRVIQGMKRAGVKNPVFVLDELDKVGADFRGDPAAALLEVLDPEQNNSFSDHYLEVPFDLSKVLFIATANQLDTIPPALRDRLEIIEIPGYTHAEKVAIARGYLIPKQRAEHGLGEQAVVLTPAALDEVIDHYTREAGVRELERQIASLMRSVAVKVAAGEITGATLDVAEVAAPLGPRRFDREVAERTAEPGVAVGLAWTPAGGDILFIEATKMVGGGKLILTGQLGDVMRESAHAALSYVRSHTKELGLEDVAFDRLDLHIHVPAGATPKDGPSAGVTLFSALVSLLTGRRVQQELAMTGEITLRGQVLPVGGIKEKVLAAHRAGIKHVMLPERNRKDLVDVPADARAELQITFVKTMDEVLATGLETAPAAEEVGVVPGSVDGPTKPATAGPA